MNVDGISLNEENYLNGIIKAKDPNNGKITIVDDAANLEYADTQKPLLELYVKVTKLKKEAFL